MTFEEYVSQMTDGKGKLTGTVSPSETFPMLYCVVIASMELVDGKIVSATGADNVQYAFVEHERDGKRITALLADPGPDKREEEVTRARKAEVEFEAKRAAKQSALV
jgi:hypothetical protein